MSDIFSEASNWIRERGSEWVDGAKSTYSSAVNTLKDGVKTLAPVGAGKALDEIYGGINSLGRDAIDFLDPVSYATDLVADAANSIAPKHAIRKGLDIYKIQKGVDADEAKEDLKSVYLDESLVAGQVALALLPGGHVAGKLAAKPLKKTAKELKRAMKATERGTPERVIAKQQFKKKKHQASAAKVAGWEAGRSVKEFGRDQITDYRIAHQKASPFDRKIHVKSRNWDDFGKEHDPSARFHQG